MQIHFPIWGVRERENPLVDMSRGYCWFRSILNWSHHHLVPLFILSHIQNAHVELWRPYEGIRVPLMTPVNSELVTTATEERVIVERRFENLGKWQLNPHAYPFVYLWANGLSMNPLGWLPRGRVPFNTGLLTKPMEREMMLLNKGQVSLHFVQCLRGRIRE